MKWHIVTGDTPPTFKNSPPLTGKIKVILNLFQNEGISCILYAAVDIFLVIYFFCDKVLSAVIVGDHGNLLDFFHICVDSFNYSKILSLKLKRLYYF